ncbi:uncharacterized protein with ParB-like and HNH nuclease domain [Asanoa ferruginea]|uniref:Uncharacterized protein with ParB-like and HNH nuclease domain n=1 Tax=Asanoa ferruginea TaxID=53367 RepID=A0A3D9Z9Z7_9ACTN|nr:DUF262 domain-containing protein [Asanoa ferruginea]REF94226.1 uncharacterized protein with ParB-like and HNH nuclease domain [Asanoa ferruginea]GIF49826.1 hypothetical protein Afe04nite_43650 [Asanoa ferruginea]
MSLKAHEHPLKKIFSADFDFAIPDYQRPYAWGTEQALQLLDDLEDALDQGSTEPYFLGSLVLVKPDENQPAAQVIDGQQRLTTLSILFALLRDLAEKPDAQVVLGDMVLEPGVALDGILPKPRLRLRPQDSGFFAAHVQTPGRFDGLLTLSDHALATDSQRAIRDNAKALRGRLSAWTDEKRSALAGLARNRTFLVVVSTPDLASAHRIFSVMNARGLDLEPSDIFKSDVIGAVDPSRKVEYARTWETAEQNLGRKPFADLFLHLRTIVAKTRGQRELLIEFPQQVLNAYLESGRATDFIDDMLIPYATAYSHVLNRDYDQHDPAWRKVNNWLQRLSQLDNNDWRPPAMWALKNHDNDPQFLDVFLRRLERLAASMLLRRVYTTPRVTRYIDLLRHLDGGAGVKAVAFDLSPDERQETREQLAGELYKALPVRKYVLLRLDELLANAPGVSYEHKIISIEHVLPQKPRSDSQWLKDFSDNERAFWTHRLGNLLLLNRSKNGQAQNYDFATKKEKYFGVAAGVTGFALTTTVVTEPVWTPEVVERRQTEFTAALIKEWELD